MKTEDLVVTNIVSINSYKELLNFVKNVQPSFENSLKKKSNHIFIPCFARAEPLFHSDYFKPNLDGINTKLKTSEEIEETEEFSELDLDGFFEVRTVKKQKKKQLNYEVIVTTYKIVPKIHTGLANRALMLGQDYFGKMLYSISMGVDLYFSHRWFNYHKNNKMVLKNDRIDFIRPDENNAYSVPASYYSPLENWIPLNKELKEAFYGTFFNFRYLPLLGEGKFFKNLYNEEFKHSSEEYTVTELWLRKKRNDLKLDFEKPGEFITSKRYEKTDYSIFSADSNLDLFDLVRNSKKIYNLSPEYFNTYGSIVVPYSKYVNYLTTLNLKHAAPPQAINQFTPYLNNNNDGGGRECFLHPSTEKTFNKVFKMLTTKGNTITIESPFELKQTIRYCMGDIIGYPSSFSFFEFLKTAFNFVYDNKGYLATFKNPKYKVYHEVVHFGNNSDLFIQSLQRFSFSSASQKIKIFELKNENSNPVDLNLLSAAGIKYSVIKGNIYVPKISIWGRESASYLANVFFNTAVDNDIKLRYTLDFIFKHDGLFFYLNTILSIFKEDSELVRYLKKHFDLLYLREIDKLEPVLKYLTDEKNLDRIKSPDFFKGLMRIYHSENIQKGLKEIFTDYQITALTATIHMWYFKLRELFFVVNHNYFKTEEKQSFSLTGDSFMYYSIQNIYSPHFNIENFPDSVINQRPYPANLFLSMMVFVKKHDHDRFLARIEQIEENYFEFLESCFIEAIQPFESLLAERSFRDTVELPLENVKEEDVKDELLKKLINELKAKGLLSHYSVFNAIIFLFWFKLLKKDFENVKHNLLWYNLTSCLPTYVISLVSAAVESFEHTNHNIRRASSLSNMVKYYISSNDFYHGEYTIYDEISTSTLNFIRLFNNLGNFFIYDKFGGVLVGGEELLRHLKQKRFDLWEIKEMGELIKKLKEIDLESTNRSLQITKTIFETIKKL